VRQLFSLENLGVGFLGIAILASPSPKPLSSPVPPKVCPEREHLSDLYIEAVRDIVSLLDYEVKAIAGGASLDRVDLALELARSKKHKIKQAYLLHVRVHGC
jgi:hypothetical protein